MYSQHFDKKWQNSFNITGPYYENCSNSIYMITQSSFMSDFPLEGIITAKHKPELLLNLNSVQFCTLLSWSHRLRALMTRDWRNALSKRKQSSSNRLSRINRLSTEKEGSTRFYIDYTKLKYLTRWDFYPFPTIEGCFEALIESTVS